MSASPRPITASPRSRTNVFTGRPSSSSTAIDGAPACMLSASAGCAVLLTETRSPTRVPQSEQKRSAPFIYLAPQLLQAFGCAFVVVRVPQCPQYDCSASTWRPHFRHFVPGPLTAAGTGLADEDALDTD